MRKLTLTEKREYERLFGKYKRAVNIAFEEMMRNGIESAEFLDADKKAEAILAEMRRLRGERWIGSQ
jgi:hypothetical protein